MQITGKITDSNGVALGRTAILKTTGKDARRKN
jgi:hypothetical protein